MYPITQNALDLFLVPERQVVDITVNPVSGASFHITEDDIPVGGLSVNRYSASSGSLALGTATAAEATIKLDNTDGRFDNVVFEGARLFIMVGVADWDDPSADVNYVPLGYFTVDEAPRRLAEISFSALDDMVLFDKPVDLEQLNFPITLSDLTSRICSICNVTLGTNVALLPNGNYSVSKLWNDAATYRQILMWIAQLTGTCAFIDYNGNLVLKWYTEAQGRVGKTITPAMRVSTDVAEEQITITGISISGNKSNYIAGSDDYALSIADNGLADVKDFRSLANNIYTAIGGFVYRPFTASSLPLPHLWPLDKIFLTVSDRTYITCVTSTTFVLNGNMSLAATGETDTQKGYAALNPLTAQEQAIIHQLQEEQNTTLNDRVQTVLAFNELISNALGLFVTRYVHPDGSVTYYMHDAQTLEESTVIFTMTANGIAWTNSGWNDGSPIWSYGVTNAGDALFRLISAEGIEVSKAGEDYSISVTPSTFSIYYRSMLVTQINADEMTIPKTNITKYLQIGNVRMIANGNNGINIVVI